MRSFSRTFLPLYFLISLLSTSSLNAFVMPFSKNHHKKTIPEEWVFTFNTIKQIEKLERKLIQLFIFSVKILKDDLLDFDDKKDFFENVEEYTNAVMILYKSTLQLPANSPEEPLTRDVGIRFHREFNPDEETLQALQNYVDLLKGSKSNPWPRIIAISSLATIFSSLVTAYLITRSTRWLSKEDHGFWKKNLQTEENKK